MGDAITNIIITLICVVILTLLLAQCVFRYIYNYRITRNGIEIVLFRKLPIISIPFENIADIREIAFWETLPFKSIDMFFALRLGNKVWGKIVLVQQRQSIIKILLITPTNTDEFVREVKQHIQTSNL